MGAKAPLGIVLNFDHATPASDRAEDVAAAARWDGIFNRWFIEGITRQTYPEVVLEGLAPHMPQGWQDDMAVIGQKLDWLGVNYYTRHLHAHDESQPWPHLRTCRVTCPRPRWAGRSTPRG